MSQLDDQELYRPEREAEEPEPGGRGRAWILAAGLVVLAAAAIGVWMMVGRDAPRDTAAPVRADRLAPVPQLPAGRGELGPAVEPIDLPPLDLTDPVVRELLRHLSSRPELAAWLASDNLIRKLVVSIENVAAGKNPSRQLAAVKPRGTFQAQSRGDTLRIDPRSYARYDGLAATLQSVDPADLARVYSLLKPRMRDAYGELGHADGDIDAALERALVHLLQTPILEGEIEVGQPSVQYTFTDPAVERLSPAQKQLIRLGPRNQRIVQEQLRRIARELGIPEDRLPAA